MAIKARNISYTLLLLTFLTFSIAIVEAKNDIITTSNAQLTAPSEKNQSEHHYDIQETLEKLRSLAPKHKLYAVRQKDSEEYRPHCDIVVGVPEGDTCDSIMGILTIFADSFYSLNPNVDCNNLFPGQWVCVVGHA